MPAIPATPPPPDAADAPPSAGARVVPITAGVRRTAPPHAGAEGRAPAKRADGAKPDGARAGGGHDTLMGLPALAARAHAGRERRQTPTHPPPPPPPYAPPPIASAGSAHAHATPPMHAHAGPSMHAHAGPSMHAHAARATTEPGFVPAPVPPFQLARDARPAVETAAHPLEADAPHERPSFTDVRPIHADAHDARAPWAAQQATPDEQDEGASRASWASPPRERSPLSLPLLAAALVIVALVGGGLGALLARRSPGSDARASVANVPPVAGERAGGAPAGGAVAFRIRPDLGAITAEPPRFAVRVEAAPGAVVELAGERLALDARGRGHRDFPLRAEPAGNVITERVPYRVVPPGGEPSTGEVVARIPVATLELDRPGSALVTDAASVAVEGAAQSTATVTVNGVPVAVRDGAFQHVVALPAPGEHAIEVVARAAGHAPEREVVVVRRVADLAAEAAGYEVDPSLTYARIAADPASSRGQRVALEGVVYNVEVRRGESMLQVLVSGCGAARCPLWVTYPAATDVQLDETVRVLGEVDGEQRFRATGPGGQVLSVPRLRAVYVLPLAR